MEIDAWDNEQDKIEPKVTHGYTLTSHISFRSVCEVMRDFVDKEMSEPTTESGYRPAPVFLSLENHCDTQGQLRLVQIMKEVWGDRLISQHVQIEDVEIGRNTRDVVTLEQLGAKIAVIVEYHFPNQLRRAEEVHEDDAEEVDEAKEDRKAYEQKKEQTPKVGIIPKLT